MAALSEAPASSPTEIVVVGGGYTALWGYRSMARRLRRRVASGEVRITVVSASRYHGFHGWTGEVLGGLVRYQRTRTPLPAILPRARVIHGRAAAADLRTKTVTVEVGTATITLPYDHLLIGVGSADATDAIPGLSEHGWRVKGDEDLLATKSHLDSVIADAAATGDRKERERLLSVVVAGGGFAGTEMAAAIAERLNRAAARDPRLAGTRPRVTLVHGGSEILPEMRPRFGRFADYAVRQLDHHGVEVRLGTRLTAVTPEGAVVSGGVRIPAATVLSTVGQRILPLPGTESLQRQPDGRIVADAWLRTSHPGAWAGGDVAAVPHVMSGKPCPPNALWAIKHGIRVGDNIARSLQGRNLRKFRFLGLGTAASFGVGRGAGELYGIQLTGWVGWMTRWAFFHWFMPSRRMALCTIADWLALPFRGRFEGVGAVVSEEREPAAA